MTVRPTLQSRPVIMVVEQVGTGGITRAVMNQAQILIEHGFDVTMATVLPERDDFLEKADRGNMWPAGPHSRRNLPNDWPDRWQQAQHEPEAITRLQIEWLSSLAAEHQTRPFLIAEHRNTINMIQHISARTAVRIGVIHDNQFDTVHKAYKIPVIADESREHILGGVWALNALVGLTEQQTNDLRALVGPWAARVHEAPNEAQMPSVDYPQPQPNHVAVVSRLIPRKRVSEIIRAFAEVVAARPETTMDIYGGGSSKQGLIDLTEELGLQHAITFHLSTVTPLDAMATGLFGILTSGSEAMPLTLLESYSVGRPVLSYKFRYGPQSMIEDGVTGYLIDKNDRATLARRMIELLDDPAGALEMGRAGRELARQRFSREQVWLAWERLLTDAARTRSCRLPFWLTTPRVKIRGEWVSVVAAAHRYSSRRARERIGL